MKFDVKTQGKKMEVALEGRMDSATAPGFEKEIFQKLDGVTELVLDFTDLAYLFSAGLRVLLSCQKKMNAAKGSILSESVLSSVPCSLSEFVFSVSVFFS